MDVSTIIKLSRRQTATSEGQIDDWAYLDYLNDVYKDIFSRLSINSKKYTRQTYTTDVSAGQSEYIIPKPSETQTWIKLVLGAFLKGEKIKIYDTEISNKLEENRAVKPYGIIRDGSIFIQPTPTEDILQGLVIQGKYIPMDLVMTDTADEIKLPAEYHDVLLAGLNKLIFAEKQIYDKFNFWKQEYEEGVMNTKIEWAFENESWYIVEEPDLSFLE